MGKLVAIRVHQLQYKNKNLKKTALYFQCSRKQGKKKFDFQKWLQIKKLNTGVLVLLHNTKLKF